MITHEGLTSLLCPECGGDWGEPYYFRIRPLVRWRGARCVDCGAPLDGYPEDAKICPFPTLDGGLAR